MIESSNLGRMFWNRLFYLAPSFRVACPLPQMWESNLIPPELLFCPFNRGNNMFRGMPILSSEKKISKKYNIGGLPKN